MFFSPTLTPDAPLRLQKELVLPHLGSLLDGGAGLGARGAFFPPISVKFPFWKQRNGTCCLHHTIPGGRGGENHAGGSCGCSSSPQPAQEAIAAPTFCYCLESPLLPLLFFSKHRDPGSPSHLNGAGQAEKCRTGAVAWGRTSLPVPTCPQHLGCCSPASSPSHWPQHEGRSFPGSG